MKRVLILSRWRLWGRGIENLLCQEAGLQVVGCEIDLDKALERIRELQPDVLVLDSDDPAPEVLRILRQEVGTKIIGLNPEDNTMCIYRGEQREVRRIEDLVEAICL